MTTKDERENLKVISGDVKIINKKMSIKIKLYMIVAVVIYILFFIMLLWSGMPLNFSAFFSGFPAVSMVIVIYFLSKNAERSSQGVPKKSPDELLRWGFNNSTFHWDELTLTTTRLICRHGENVSSVGRRVQQKTIFDIPVSDVVNLYIEKGGLTAKKLIIEIAIGQGLGVPSQPERYEFGYPANNRWEKIDEFYEAIQRQKYNAPS